MDVAIPIPILEHMPKRVRDTAIPIHILTDF